MPTRQQNKTVSRSFTVTTVHDGEDASYIYLRGTGNNHSAARLVYISNQTNQSSYPSSGRGIEIVTVLRETLEKVESRIFDTYGGTVSGHADQDAACNAAATYLNGLDDTVFVCITSYDAIGWNGTLIGALKNFGLGALAYTATGRYPFAFLGYKGLQEGYALWQIHGTDASEPYAEVSAYIVNGVFMSSKDGENGTSPWIADLDNEMDSVACASSGEVSRNQSVSTNVSLYYGNTPKNFSVAVFADENLTDAYVNGTEDNGITVSWTAGNNSSNAIQVVFSQGDAIFTSNKMAFYIRLTAQEDSSIQRVLCFTVNGLRPGANGTSPTIYNLLPSQSQISVGRTSSGGYSPATASLTCGYTAKTGNSAPQTETDATGQIGGAYYIYYRKRARGGSLQATYYRYGTYKAYGTQAYTLTNFNVATYDAVEFILCNATDSFINVSDVGNYTVVDKETVPVVADGAKGQDGEGGQDAHEINTNILLRTIFDKGIDFVKEKWEIIPDTASPNHVFVAPQSFDTWVDGRASLRLSAMSFGAGVQIRQDVTGKIKPNTYYTLSFNAYYTGGGQFIISFYNEVNGSRANIFSGDVIVDGVSKTPSSNSDVQIFNTDSSDTSNSIGDWTGTRHTVTFRTRGSEGIATSGLYLIFYQAYHNSGNNNHSISDICMPKLEEGQVATAYLPHEDDLVGDATPNYWLVLSQPAVSFRSDATGGFVGNTNKTVSCTVWKKNGDNDDERLSSSPYDGKYYLYYRLVRMSSIGNWAAGSSYSISYSTALYSSTNTNPVVGIDFCLSTASSSGNVSTSNTIATTSCPVTCDGRIGATGATGKMFFPMGVYDHTATYSRTGEIIPLVFFDNGVDNDVNGARGAYFYLSADTNVSGTTHYAPASYDGDRIPYTYTSGIWEEASMYGLVITQGIFAEFAKLGSGVMSGDCMFSSFVVNEYNMLASSQTISQETAYMVIPGQDALPVKQGVPYTLTIKAKATNSNVLFLRVYYLNDTYEPSVASNWENYAIFSSVFISLSNQIEADYTLSFISEYTGYVKVYFYGYGEVFSIKSKNTADYKKVSAQFMNADTIDLLPYGVATVRTTSSVNILNNPLPVRSGMSYRYNFRAYVSGSGVTMYVMAYINNNLTASISLTNTTATDKALTFTANADGYVYLRGRVSSGVGYLARISMTPLSPFIPMVGINWLTGYAHFSGDRVRFNPDGSGHLAAKNVRWDSTGNVSVSGTIVAKDMYKTLALSSGGTLDGGDLRTIVYDGQGGTDCYIYILQNVPSNLYGFAFYAGSYYTGSEIDSLVNSNSTGCWQNDPDYFIMCTGPADEVLLVDNNLSTPFDGEVYLPRCQDYAGKLVTVRHNMTSAASSAIIKQVDGAEVFVVGASLYGFSPNYGTNPNTYELLPLSETAVFYSTGTRWVRLAKR